MAEMSTKHGHVRYVSLTDSGIGLITRLLPDLYEPVLILLGNWILVLRGFERCDGEGGKFSVVGEAHREWNAMSGQKQRTSRNTTTIRKQAMNRAGVRC